MSDYRDAGDGPVNQKQFFPWRGAVINHCALRTRDLFLIKTTCGDAMGSRLQKCTVLTSRWHQSVHMAALEDRSLQRHLGMD